MIHVQQYTDTSQEDWDAFIHSSINGTFLSTRKFLNYHPPSRFTDHSLLVKRGRNILAVIPASESFQDGKKNFMSHPGVTYGGLIFRGNPLIAEVGEVITAVEHYLITYGFNNVFLKQTPHIFHGSPAQTIDFALLYSGFASCRTELSTSIFLGSAGSEDEVLASCNAKTRNQCRLGYKNDLSFRYTNDYEAFHKMLEDNLQLHQKSPIHTVEEMRFLADIFPDNIRLYGVFCDQEMIAGSWVFKFGNRVFHTQYLAMNYEFKKLAPMNFLILKLIVESVQASFQYFNFGVSTFEGGTKINWSLFKFKESFGGGGIMLQTYHKELQI